MSMDTQKTSDIPVVMPSSQRMVYQFPVYRWIGWLTVAGYAIGLVIMFFLAGMFGIHAPIGWAFLVLVFCVGTFLLDRPKLLLNCMMFYFLLMPSNRLFGLIGLPLPGFIDELFFLPFIAVMIMNWIQRRSIQGGTWFPIAFIVVGLLSWYVNGKGAPFRLAQVTLIMLKFYIIWYYCRLTCIFEDAKHFWRWGELYIYYAAIQFLYNCLWQRGPFVRFHPDNSGGVFGPDGSGGAHLVGYISILALFLLAGWWMGPGRAASRRKRYWMLFLCMVISYDLIFMTDTKHGLLMMPVAFIPFVFHPIVPARTRSLLLGFGGVFLLLAFSYVATFTNTRDFRKFLIQMADSPKGEMMHAVTGDFKYLVPYPMLGAGPGKFGSSQSAKDQTRLARRYILPYEDEMRRSGLTYRGGTRTGGSQLAWPQSDFFTLMGEFGWVGTLVYFSFFVWVCMKLWGKAKDLHQDANLGGAYLALGAGVIFLAETMFVVMSVTVPVLAFPLWMLAGRVWDMKLASSDSGELDKTALMPRLPTGNMPL